MNHSTFTVDRSSLRRHRTIFDVEVGRASHSDALGHSSSHRILLSLFGLILLSSIPGCTLCLNAKRTIIDEPLRFSWQTDRKQSVEVYRMWADQAWGVNCSSNGDSSISEPYEIGFKDGFVDYVYAGGTGEPPPIAPRKFWNVDLRNPHGNAAAAQWFEGYRLGARVAREEGYRERALAPTQSLLLGPSQEYRSSQSAVGPEYTQPLQSWPQAEPIPQGSATRDHPPEPTLELPPQDGLTIEAPLKDELSPQTTEELSVPPVAAPELQPLATPKVESPQSAFPPQPKTVPFEPETELPNIPAPPSEAPSEVDDIFGPPSAFQSTSTRVGKQPKHSQQNALAERNPESQQARTAFAAAIRSKLSQASAQANHLDRPNKQFTYKMSMQPLNRRKPAITPPKAQDRVVQATAVSAPQALAIPQAEDQAAEMFRQLSQ